MASSVTLPAQLATLIPKPRASVSCQELIRLCTEPLTGFMRKEPEDLGFVKTAKGLLRLKWPRKFVVLGDGCLYIFKTESSQTCERATSLFGYDQVIAEEQQNTDLPWAFKLSNCLTDREKSMRFSVESEQMRTKWMERFTAEMLASNAPLLAGQPQPDKRNPKLRLSHSDKKRISSIIRTDDLEYVVCLGDSVSPQEADTEDELSIYDDIDTPSEQRCPRAELPASQLPPTKPQPIKQPIATPNGNVKKISNGIQMPGAKELASNRKPSLREDDDTYLEADQPIYDDVDDKPDPRARKLPPLPTSPVDLGMKSKPLQLPHQSSADHENTNADSNRPVAGRRCPQPPPINTRPTERNPSTESTTVSRENSTENAADAATDTRSESGPKPRSKQPPPPKPKPTPRVKPLQPADIEPLETRGVPPLPTARTPSHTSNDSATSDEITESYSGFTEKKSDDASNDDDLAFLTDDDCLSDPKAKAAFISEDHLRCSEIMSACSREGTYMIRNPTKQDEKVKTLMVRITSRQVAKFRLAKTKTNHYTIQQGDKVVIFESLTELIGHYQNNNLPGRTTTLSVPYTAA